MVEQRPDAAHNLRVSPFGRPGYAADYQRGRPSLSDAVVALLCQYARVERPQLVIDLGCGTGLSTLPWLAVAERVVGVEAEPAMLAIARSQSAAVDWREGQAHQTGLPAACADVVTCVQALHWMDPTVTLPEIARLLRPGGVFAAVDYDGPPSVDWELEQAATAFVAAVRRRGRERGVGPPDWRFWPKAGQLDALRQSGLFGYVREVVLHGELVRDASWFVTGTLNQALDGLEPYRAAGLTDAELGLPAYRALVERLVGGGRRCFLGYCIRLGVTVP